MKYWVTNEQIHRGSDILTEKFKYKLRKYMNTKHELISMDSM